MSLATSPQLVSLYTFRTFFILQNISEGLAIVARSLRISDF
jgi:hypothetical protein